MAHGPPRTAAARRGLAALPPDTGSPEDDTRPPGAGVPAAILIDFEYSPGTPRRHARKARRRARGRRRVLLERCPRSSSAPAQMRSYNSTVPRVREIDDRATTPSRTLSPKSSRLRASSSTRRRSGHTPGIRGPQAARRGVTGRLLHASCSPGLPSRGAHQRCPLIEVKRIPGMQPRVKERSRRRGPSATSRVFLCERGRDRIRGSDDGHGAAVHRRAPRPAAPLQRGQIVSWTAAIAWRTSAASSTRHSASRRRGSHAHS